VNGARDDPNLLGPLSLSLLRSHAAIFLGRLRVKYGVDRVSNPAGGGAVLFRCYPHDCGRRRYALRNSIAPFGAGESDRVGIVAVRRS
jgi:hypothetical protein